MEYKKKSNFLDSGAALNASNQRSKFRKNSWVEINDKSRQEEDILQISKFNLTHQC